MKIVCDSCSTKYSISDDKVRGKVFKIRCKKCSHIIVVKGTTEALPAAPEAPVDAVWHLVVDGDQVGPLTDSDVRARLARSEITAENYVWKEGFGDWLRLADVPEFADVASSSDAATAASFSAPVASELFSSDSDHADATEVGQRQGEGAGEGGGMAGYFSGGGAPDGAMGEHGGFSLGAGHGFANRQRTTSSEVPVDEDAFSSPAGPAALSGGGGADLFGAVVPAARVDSGRVRGRGSNGAAASGRHDGGRVENLTAQRSENSVLFSLSNLQSLAAPAPASTKPGAIQATEGSGLIDIRAMAASTLKGPSSMGLPSFGSDSRGSSDDLPAFGAFSSAAPVLLSIPSSSGPPKWVYALVAVAAVMIIAVGAAAFSILGKPVMVEPQAAAPVAVPGPQVPSGTSTSKPTGKGKTGVAMDEDSAPAASKTIADGDLPPREAADSANATDKNGDKAASDKAGTRLGKHKGAKGSKTAPGGGSDKGGGAVTASAPSAAAAPAEVEKKPAKGSLDDLLDNALNNGRKTKPKVDDDAPSSNRKAAASSESAGGGSAGPLAKGAVVAGMNGVKGKVSACYAQFKVPGMAMVNVVIGKSGKVSSATVTGKFAGTPTGSCVESAVKSASFPPSDGLTTPYPFSLR